MFRLGRGDKLLEGLHLSEKHHEEGRTEDLPLNVVALFAPR